MESVKYVKMRTTARVNYRNEMNTDDDSVEGILNTGSTVSAVENFYVFKHGHFWRKVKIHRRHFFIMTDYLEDT